MSRIAEKKRLRRRLKKRRDALDAAALGTASARIEARLLELPELSELAEGSEAARGLLMCVPMGSEPRIRGLFDRMAARGHAVYLPRIDGEAMTLHRYPCPLEKLPFGLEQPAATVPALPDAEIADAVDVALVPGVAFDLEGYRLGYGGGFFDRFFAAYPEVLPIGLGFETQIVEALPRQDHDRPMRLVVTEARVRRFEACG